MQSDFPSRIIQVEMNITEMTPKAEGLPVLFNEFDNLTLDFIKGFEF